MRDDRTPHEEALSQRNEEMRVALKQLLDEVLAAGFGTAKDYNWPKAIADARQALGRS